MTASITRIGVSPAVVADLARSGLEAGDLGVRQIGPAEAAATGVLGSGGDGYVIPYFDLEGQPVAFYRVRLLNPVDDVKYRQPAKEQNFIYFPKGVNPQGYTIKELIKHTGKVIITEGEKKAAAGFKQGFPVVAVSGVDSWKSRTLTLPKDTKLSAKGNTGQVVAKIPQGESDATFLTEHGLLAQGLQNLIDLCCVHKITAIIIFDSEADGGGVKVEVQRAAAKLGYELRYRGLPLHRIRQVVLPARGTKVGLDDFLMKADGALELDRLIRVCLEKRTAFPRHPNPQVYIATRLNKGRLSRREWQEVAMSIMAELEAKGKRLRVEASQELHFFDEDTHTLYPVQMNNQRIPLYETPFGAYLYRTFGLGSADRNLVDWLATQFTGEEPLYSTETHKVITRPKEQPFIGSIAYQLNDSQYAIVTADPNNPLVIRDNGTHGILFEQGQVEPIKPAELEYQFARHLDLLEEPEGKVLWYNIFQGLNVRSTTLEGGEADGERVSREQTRKLISLLYYISPWLQRWRGTQLPIELVIGEAGSGKSSLMHLRQRVVTGKPYLSNLTTDIRDWYAGITARGGVHVLDNVHFTAAAKDFRQRLSDEICRIITEPSPHVEMRKLYTSNTVLNLPIHATMAVTSIEQPFYNTDLLQRAAIFELQALERNHESEWVSRQLQEGGGRAGWVGHHLAVIHQFLNTAVTQGQWDQSYRARHRLANYEQCLIMMGHIFGWNDCREWIPSALAHTIREHLTEGDWVHQGIADYVRLQIEEDPDTYMHETYMVADICNWCQTHEAYSKNAILTSPRSLGRYVQSHRQALEESLGWYEKGSKSNRITYGIRKQSDG